MSSETAARLGGTITYDSSLRERSIAETLVHARRYAERLGITRVTDITRLDSVGVPVFASIRPGAKRGSLCVNAGKGATVEEARVGAYMEAIEFAMAEYGASPVAVVHATARDVLDGPERPDAVLDFCPAIGKRIPLDAPMPCVEAEELVSGSRCLVPVEAVFIPTPAEVVRDRYFGSHSSGLASGNSVLEATVHGLAEVIERDVASFHELHDTSVPIDPDSFPFSAAVVAQRIAEAGLRLAVRYQANGYRMPWFKAMLFDPQTRTHVFINAGFGCHPHARIAITRAITEALQSRLSFIHGGRDDLVNRYRRFADWPETNLRDFVARFAMEVDSREHVMRFETVPDHSGVAPDLRSTYDVLQRAVIENGMPRTCRVVFTSDADELQVVRVIVPGAEYFQETSARVGKRLRDHVRAH